MGNPVRYIRKMRVDGKNASDPHVALTLKVLDDCDLLFYGNDFKNILSFFQYWGVMCDKFYVSASSKIYCLCGTYTKDKWAATEFYKKDLSQKIKDIKESAGNVGDVADFSLAVATGNVASASTQVGFVVLKHLYRALLTRRYYFMVLTQDDSTRPIILTKYLQGQEKLWCAADWDDPQGPKQRTTVTYNQISNVLEEQQGAYLGKCG
jgi:hypothetical protein